MVEMTPRERVLTALDHREPDRVPLDLNGGMAAGINSTAYRNLQKFLGLDEPLSLWTARTQIDAPSETLLRRFHVDTRQVRVATPQDIPDQDDAPDSYVDYWGVSWVKPHGGHYLVEDAPFKHLADPVPADLESHRWPDPTDPFWTEGLAEAAREFRRSTDCAVTMQFPFFLLMFGNFLRDFDNWMTDLVLRPNFAEALMDRGLEIQLEIGGRMLEAVGDNIDILCVGEDLGIQTGPLIFPETYRRLIKPRHKRLFAFIKSRTKAKLYLHSCGSVYRLIPDLIEMGVDVLNPVQVSAADMDTARLKREFGKDLAFWGAVDTHQVLPMGSERDVRVEVRRRIDDLAPGGGYVLSAVHNILAEVPPENIVAMYEEAYEYGGYH